MHSRKMALKLGLVALSALATLQASASGKGAATQKSGKATQELPCSHHDNVGRYANTAYSEKQDGQSAQTRTTGVKGQK